jgi:hypothetical protein
LAKLCFELLVLNIKVDGVDGSRTFVIVLPPPSKMQFGDRCILKGVVFSHLNTLAVRARM